MIQPADLKEELPVRLANDVTTTTSKVWEVLQASANGDLVAVKNLTVEIPELAYAQYNYTPPVYFAVREGRVEVVEYLLSLGAYSPAHRTYPFLDNLETLALDRGYLDIAQKLNRYAAVPEKVKYRGDNGAIGFVRTDKQKEFEQAVDRSEINKVRKMLEKDPDLLQTDTYFWGEGILAMPAKEGHFELIDLLMDHGAKVHPILKWGQFYHFERTDGAAYLLKKGADPNTMSWHRVTLLHDMAWKSNIEKAELFLTYGADINALDDEYRSTPLGFAARWGQEEMVRFLLQQGADPDKAGTIWSTPLAWARKRSLYTIEELLLEAGAK